MREVEQVFRDGLAELAGEADASPSVVRGVVEGARSGRGRGRRAALAAVGAAAAVVVLVTGIAVTLQQGREGREATAPGSTGTTPPGAPSAPDGYRLELWHDVGVHVPVSWGWGSAPVVDDSGSVVLCGGSQVVQEDGSRRISLAQPYVGRPVRLSGDCDAGWSDERPLAPYVWLGTDLRAGAVDLGGGWVRQTVRVGDVSVTVASDDRALRETVLASAHRVTGACEPRIDSPPTPGGTTERGFVPVSMTVCAYAPSSTGLDYDLLYESELTMGPAKYLVDAVDHAAPLGSSSCFSASGGEWALLRLRGSGGSLRDYVVDMSCPSIADPTGTQHVLDSETVVPWAVGGVNAVLHTSPLIKVPDRFIPPLP